MAIHKAAKLSLLPGIGAKAKRKRVMDPFEGMVELPKVDLPDPAPLLPAIATMVIEVISGTRSVDQVANLVSDQVYEKLRGRISAKQAATATAIRPPLMPKFVVGKIRSESPIKGVVESVVLVTTQARTRAVAIRLEPVHDKWRATSISVL